MNLFHIAKTDRGNKSLNHVVKNVIFNNFENDIKITYVNVLIKLF